MTKSGKLWGGRFTGEADETFREFNDSFRFDRRLFAADVRASVAHARGMAAAGVLSPDEFASIESGLRELSQNAASNVDFFTDSTAEDVHSFIEAKLIDLIGDAGRKVHTGRSRNDQVATAFRLWLRDEVNGIDVLVRDLQLSMIDLAARSPDAVIPGYTHLQRAQPVLFAHWCLAYFEMFKRDRERLEDAQKRINVLPLGSGALAGTGYAIDRDAVAAELGFDAVTANSLDAVSDRDFAVEFTSVCSLIMVHLSRLAEDLIIYCSQEFGLISLSDSVSGGSSLMPQKKNPDALELLRGKSGRIFGHNMAMLAMLKGLPLAYNKDMQEDKEAVFDTVDTIRVSLRTAKIVIENASLNVEKGRVAASTGYLNATELADYLVKKGVPFRTAHEAVGKAVLHGIEKGLELNELTPEELRSFSPDIGDDVVDSLSVESAIAAKSAIGGTSTARVTDALRAAREYLDQ